MDTSILTQWLSQRADGALPWLIDAALKGLVVLLFAGIVCILLRKASAAARHALWSATAGALLAMPVLSAILPEWHIVPTPRWNLVPAAAPRREAPVILAPMARPVQQQPTQVAAGGPAAPAPAMADPSASRQGGAASATTIMDSGVFRPAAPAQPVIAAPPPPSLERAATRISIGSLALILYISGVVLVMVRPILGLIALLVLRRRTTPVTDEAVLAIAGQCAERLGLRRKPL